LRVCVLCCDEGLRGSVAPGPWRRGRAAYLQDFGTNVNVLRIFRSAACCALRGPKRPTHKKSEQLLSSEV
jgi:hypothetical protein